MGGGQWWVPAAGASGLWGMVRLWMLDTGTQEAPRGFTAGGSGVKLRV